jgi:hypothetical protein
VAKQDADLAVVLLNRIFYTGQTLVMARDFLGQASVEKHGQPDVAKQ